VILIYALIISIFIPFLPSSSFASEDVGTFCFEKSTPASVVYRAIEFLQTGSDKIQMRRDENCLDVYSSTDRMKLYEKMIYKNFTPISTGSVEAANESFTNQCRIELKEIKKSNLNETVARAARDSKFKVSEKESDNVTRSELLMTSGKRSILTAGDFSLFVECVKTKAEIYQLSFYLGDKGNSVQTNVDVRAGEVIDLGGIARDLNEKSKTVGIPVTEIKNQTGKETTKYELKVL